MEILDFQSNSIDQDQIQSIVIPVQITGPDKFGYDLGFTVVLKFRRESVRLLSRLWNLFNMALYCISSPTIWYWMN